MKRLENKVAIITGGAAGIGAATSIRFAAEGAVTVIWDLDEARGNELATKLTAEGKTAVFAKVNTSKYDEIEAATKAVIEKYGKIDILVNNAGITRDSTLKKMTPELWQQVIDVNLTGVFYCTKIVSEYMVEKNYGRIINTSSVVALYGNFGQTNYAATKFGVIGMTKTWARELGKYQIRVNAVAPGFILTEMVLKMPENVLAGMAANAPLKRLGKPEEIANVYAWLASDEASYVHGAVISVDGGIVLGT